MCALTFARRFRYNTSRLPRDGASAVTDQKEIDRRARKRGCQAVLLEVNLEGEATKAGFLPDELDGGCRA